MSTNVSWNGSTYAIPATGEENWGGTTKVDGLLIALATYGFQRSGGLFTLASDADFGVSAGLKSIYFKSRGTVADAGVIRLAKTESIAWLNNAGSGNNTLATNSSDALLYNGVVVFSSAGLVAVAAGGTGLASYTTGDLLYASGSTTLAKLGIGTANKVLTSTGTAPAWNAIVNANIDAAAAIAYSKLALTGSVVNADIGASAAIAYSKLALTGSIVNADVSASAAIAVTKLALTAAVTAAMLNSGAASSGDVYTADGAGGGSYAAQATAPTQSYELSNLGLACSVAASALTIALKQKDGSTNPAAGTGAVKAGFRDATSANGDFVTRSVTGALSLVISSGSTLGHKSAIAHYIYVYLLDNAGTPELAVSSVLFDDGSIQSSTAEGGAGAADSNRVLYSTTARSNVAIRLIGRLKSTQATAGTWATAISEISLTPFEIQAIHASFSLTVGTANASVADSTDEILDYDTKISDTHNMVTVGASWAAVVPRSGFYLLSAALASGSDSWTLGKIFQIKVYVGGVDTLILAYLRSQVAATFAANANGEKVLHLSAGDSVDFRCRHTQGGTLAIDTGSDTYARCSLTYLGPRFVTS